MGCGSSRSADGETPVPSGDRAIRNLAWEVSDAVSATEELTMKGVDLVSEVRPFQNLRYAFFNDPDGVRFEILHYEE